MSSSTAIHYTIVPIFIRAQAFNLLVHDGVLLIGFTWFHDRFDETQEETSASSL